MATSISGASGTVSIGNGPPSGAMVALGATGTSYNFGIKDSNASILIQDTATTGTTAGFLLFKDSGGSNAAALNIYSSTSTLTSAVVLKNIKSAPVIFMTNNTERLRIDSAGNVGIGVASPSSALEVNGAIKCKDLKVALTDGLIMSSTPHINWRICWRSNVRLRKSIIFREFPRRKRLVKWGCLFRK